MELKIESMVELDAARSNAAVEEVTGTEGREAVAVVVLVEVLLYPNYSVVVLAVAGDADSALVQVLHVVANYSAEEAVAEMEQVGKEAVVDLDLIVVVVVDSDSHTVEVLAVVAVEVRDLAALDPLAG